MQREHWKSRLGFIWASVGSAVGLGSIWRFPYIVGENGGAAFIFLYIFSLLLIGFPILLSEVFIGKKTQLSPAGALKKIGGTERWSLCGKICILTGFLVSSFYGVVAGWTLLYLIRSVFGFEGIHTAQDSLALFEGIGRSFTEILAVFALFSALCLLILRTGIKRGIENFNKVVMPLLLIILLVLSVRGVFLPGGEKGIAYIFKPHFSSLTDRSFKVALGQAFFSLSLGQGTMITYGSYLKSGNIPAICLPITLFGLFVSLLAGVAIFTLVFSFGLAPAFGSSLTFQTLPLIFGKMAGGHIFGFLFFLLLFFAATTSQISALEPAIAYFTDNKKWPRKRASFTVVFVSFILGVPSALSFGSPSYLQIYGKSFFTLLSDFCVNSLIPLGGLIAVLAIAWKCPIKQTLEELKMGGGELFFKRYPFLPCYLHVAIKYLSPIIILFVVLNLYGVV